MARKKKNNTNPEYTYDENWDYSPANPAYPTDSEEQGFFDPGPVSAASESGPAGSYYQAPIEPINYYSYDFHTNLESSTDVTLTNNNPASNY